MMFPECYKYH